MGSTSSCEGGARGASGARRAEAPLDEGLGHRRPRLVGPHWHCSSSFH